MNKIIMATLLLNLVFCRSLSAAELTVSVQGVEDSQGEVRVALFSDPDEFPLGEFMTAKGIVAEKQGVSVSFEGLQPGEYAVAVYQDVNNNEELDKNFVGIPKELYGFSGKKGLGTPNFDRAKIQLDEADKNLTIEIK